MATDLDRGQTLAPVVESPGAPRLGRYFALRRNLTLSRALAARRRRDIRFRVVPYDGLEILNAGALALSALMLLILVFDPLLFAWQATLPEPVVAFFRRVTRFGKSDWILVSTGIFLILMLLLDASTLAMRQRARRTVRTAAAAYVFVSVAGAGLTANLTKYLLGRARPKLFEETGSFSFDFWSGDASWASFPSGHATTAMALGVALALLFPRLCWVLVCAACWIALSRMFVRAHYPSDVFAGCLLGGVVAWLLARGLARYRLVFGFDADGRLVRRKGASGRLI